jgi:hypothetical protein
LDPSATGHLRDLTLKRLDTLETKHLREWTYDTGRLRDWTLKKSLDTLETGHSREWTQETAHLKGWTLSPAQPYETEMMFKKL